MRLDRISDFRCPQVIEKGGQFNFCGGTLYISEEAVPILRNRNDNDDALEGVLKCDVCSEPYPVIRGVLILLSDVTTYIRENYNNICRAVIENAIPDQPVPHQMIEFLVSRGGRDARSTTQDDWDQNLPRVLSRYIQAHYGDMTEGLELSRNSWHDFVKAYKDSGSGLYNILLSMIPKTASGVSNLSAGLAVDVGCSVGRMAYELTSDFDFVYGVDLCFSAILSARRITRHSPIPQTTYSIMTDAGRWSDSALIQVEACPNIEFLVASATALPLESGSVNCLTTVNLIDVLPRPEELFKEAARVLGAEKILVMADPYCWRDTVVEQVRKRASSSDYVTLNLQEHGFKIEQHKNSIPWLLRLHDRSWDVYLCDCFSAVKSTEGRQATIQ
jgi:SAM-dependent methyltransferase/uncharacterized protein YbaR (Trm112 family)